MQRSREIAGIWRTLGLSGLLLLLPATGCAGSIQSQVLDAQTGRPLSGVVVLGVWTRVAGFPGMHHTELVEVQEAETDVEGRFTLERPSSQYNREDGESVTVYKFGYVAWNNLFVYPLSERRVDTAIPVQIQLDVFPTGADRMSHISFIDGAARSGLSSRVERPKFDKALRREWKER